MTDIKNARNFGFLIALVLLIYSFFPLLDKGNIVLWSFLLSIIFSSLSFFYPKSLIFLTKIWIKFGVILGYIIAPIVMAGIFFLVVTPTAIIIKLFNKDIIKQNFDQSVKSYWIEKGKNLSTMKNQF